MLNQKLPDENNGGTYKFRYFVFSVFALLFALAVISNRGGDANILDGIDEGELANWIGYSGAWISGLFFKFIGLASYCLAILMLLYAVRMLCSSIPLGRKWRFSGIVGLLFGATLLIAMNPAVFAAAAERHGLGQAANPNTALPGGALGQFLAAPAIPAQGVHGGFLYEKLGAVGTMIIALALLFGSAVLLYVTDFHKYITHLLASAGKARDPYPKNEAPAPTKVPVPAPIPAPAPIPPPVPTAVVSAPAPEKKPFSLRALLPRLKPTNSTDPYVDLSASAPAPVAEPTAVPAPPSATMTETVPPPVQEPVPPEPEKTLFTPPPSVVAPPHAAARTAANIAEPNVKVTVQGENARAESGTEFTLPPMTMLGKGPETSGETLETLELTKARLQQTLDNFGVDGRVTNYISGPRLTRYEITLAPGIMVDKVTRLENNIAMNLEAKSIRVLAPIPGRNAVGIEAPNSKSEAVFMRQIMESDSWKNSTAEIPIVLGKNVSGKPIILDLARAPHLLIAGSTGSGKSVCMNTLIMSLLFHFKPDELKLIMVDPKVVEFADYAKLPQLITPVINDQNKVSTALRWAVNEMEHRYRVLAKVGVKKLKEFNARPLNQALNDENGIPIPDKLPVLIVIIDELADLMMTEARPEVETCISRIAAKGRAAGVHIVVATQRPSTNVITGVIKANLPTRIAFRVGQMVDSRVILDQKGAEKLLGMGDMLYLPPGSADLERIQGAMVADADIKKVVEFVAEQAPQRFNESVIAEENEEIQEGESGTGEDDYSDDFEDVAPLVRKYLEPGDGELMKKALEVVLSTRQASTSYIQRRLKIGYNRAAELIDELEARHIVGPQTAGGNKRQILVFDEIDDPDAAARQ